MKSAYLISFFLLTVLSACEKSGTSFNTGNAGLPLREKVKVKVMVAQDTSVQRVHRYAGSIGETSATAVSFSSPGTVKTANVSNGKKVKKGDLVATLDESSAKNALEIATALKLQAEDAHSRMEKLYRNKSISEIQWMEVESKYKQAIASEKLAQKALDDCKLYAPATGIVSGKNVEAGQNVLPGVPVFKIVDIAKVKVRAFVPERDIGKINIGNKVKIQVGALENRIFDGKITNKGIAANILSRSYEIEAEIQNKDGKLLPGMLVEISLGEDDAVSRITLPMNAVLLDERNQKFVWTVSNGRARRSDVDVEIEAEVDGNKILITGIHSGDTVIVEGMQKVGNGTAVEIE